MSRQFQRRIENFTCLHCGEEIEGNGFTNHCPHCLWSKHVDVNPGDRAEECEGALEPISVEGTIENQKIVHRCVKCQATRRCKISPEDNTERLIEIVKESAERILRG